MHIDSSHRARRAVALMETAKGLIVLGSGFGLLTLLHRDVAHIAVSLVTHLHIDPSRHYAGLFLNAAEHVTDQRLWAAAALALLYSMIRLAEGYGLWFSRRWAAWLGALSGAIYLPIEVYELWTRPGAIKTATLSLNLAVVLYLASTLRRGHTPR